MTVSRYARPGAAIHPRENFYEEASDVTNMRRRSFAVLLTCALCAGGALAPAGAWAAEGDYLLKAGKVYRVDGDRERPLEDVEPQRAETGAGP